MNHIHHQFDNLQKQRRIGTIFGELKLTHLVAALLED